MQISHQLMAFAKQVPKHLETLKVWVDELLASLQSQLLVNGNAFTFIDPFTPWVVNAIHKAGASKLLKAGISFYEHNGKYVVMYNAVEVGSYASKDELIKALQHLLSKNSDELARYLDEVAQLLVKLKKYKPVKNKFPFEKLPKDGFVLKYTIDAKGVFKGVNGNILTSRDLNFVITKSGEFKIGLKHHLLGNAEDVLMAGGIRFKNGRIAEFNNWSGHYKPNLKEALILENLLQITNVPLKRAKYEIWSFKEAGNGYIEPEKIIKTIFLENINL